MYLEALERVAVGRDRERVRLADAFIVRTADPPLGDRSAGGCWKLGEEMEKRRRPESHP
jgi:hypothetical protein